MQCKVDIYVDYITFALKKNMCILKCLYSGEPYLIVS